MRVFKYHLTAIRLSGAGEAQTAVARQQMAAFCCLRATGPNNATFAAITWDLGFLLTSDS
jgi:hypothetical protein